MFSSFFPRPRILLISAVIWFIFSIAGWYYISEKHWQFIGYIKLVEASDTNLLLSGNFIFSCIYFLISIFLFYFLWALCSPHPWQLWSVLGTGFIFFATFFDVEVSVAINAWSGPFYDLVQKAFSQQGSVRASEFYTQMANFAYIAFIALSVGVLSAFFISHYVFRWRIAMNDFYLKYWSSLRLIEGAAQRVQEDTMRFSSTLEGLGVECIKALMSLIVFLPLLIKLSEKVVEIPIIGELPNALVWVALIWALFGTILLALVGVKLPGLEFQNQRVEAAYRKELIYGEDCPERADPLSTAELFANVKQNYFRVYLHYTYFNVVRIFYLQADFMLPMILLVPSIIAGSLTMGLMNQIQNALDTVRGSFQYLVNSWTTIIELLSIYKRLRGFEAVIYEESLPTRDQENLGLTS